jgi:hypothetical protein
LIAISLYVRPVAIRVGQRLPQRGVLHFGDLFTGAFVFDQVAVMKIFFYIFDGDVRFNCRN